MQTKTSFKRYEMKYLLTKEQLDAVSASMDGHMESDLYGKSTIRNIYFDTDSFLLIRRSIEKPVYKEKFRLRSYSKASDNDKIFVELKKKYDGIVYKRRLVLSKSDTMDWLCGGIEPKINRNGTLDEIEFFLKRYVSLSPKVFLSYDRDANVCKEDEDLRITFDRNILWRTSDLDLGADISGKAILPKDTVLMEIKTSKGLPMWLTRTMSENRIYKTSFSKYGTAYGQMCTEMAS